MALFTVNYSMAEGLHVHEQARLSAGTITDNDEFASQFGHPRSLSACGRRKRCQVRWMRAMDDVATANGRGCGGGGVGERRGSMEVVVLLRCAVMDCGGSSFFCLCTFARCRWLV